MVFGLVKGQTWGWLSGGTVTVIAAGLVALVAFVAIELRVTDPLLPMRLFANRPLSIGSVVVVVDFFALFGAVFFISLYLQNVQGFSPIAAGVRTLPLSVALMVCAPLSGVITERFGPRPAMVVGLAAVAGGLFSLAFLNADSGYQALWPAFALLGAGIGLVLTASRTPSWATPKSTTPGWPAGCRAPRCSWAACWAPRSSARWCPAGSAQCWSASSPTPVPRHRSPPNCPPPRSWWPRA